MASEVGSGDKKSDVKEIDGGILEGGGQILRNAISYGAVLKFPIQITNIRAGRDNPGLRPQHLTGLKLVNNLCNGQIKGSEISSTQVTLFPGDLKGGHFEADTKTAGSITLMIQVALPCALFSLRPTEITLKGGTNVTSAPQIDYFIKVAWPILAKFGFVLDVNVQKKGYYPKGGGYVMMKVNPVKKLNPINLTERGEIISIDGLAFTSGALKPKLARDCAEAAEKVIKDSLASKISADGKIDVDARYDDESRAFGNGSGIILTARTSTGCIIGADGLGRPGLSMADLGKKAAEDLVQLVEQNICVDQHLQDQLIIFMALAEGKSRVRTSKITLHTETAIFVAENLTKAKFNIEKCPDGTNIIECEGIGWLNRYF